jgi:hypothetical protein
VVVPRGPVPTTKSRLPWHFWVVGPFFVLLYGAGAYDHVMTHRRDAAYFVSQDYDDAQIAYFTDYRYSSWPLLAGAGVTVARPRCRVLVRLGGRDLVPRILWPVAVSGTHLSVIGRGLVGSSHDAILRSRACHTFPSPRRQTLGASADYRGGCPVSGDVLRRCACRLRQVNNVDGQALRRTVAVSMTHSGPPGSCC